MKSTRWYLSSGQCLAKGPAPLARPGRRGRVEIGGRGSQLSNFDTDHENRATSLEQDVGPTDHMKCSAETSEIIRIPRGEGGRGP